MASVSRRAATIAAVFPNPNAAYLITIAGVAIGYLELLRPGMIVPGVSGAVLALLGVASLAGHPISPRAVALMVAGILLAVADARFRMRGVAAASGAILLTLGSRWLVADSATAIRWSVAAGGSIPFLAATWWLLEKAFEARANKLQF